MELITEPFPHCVIENMVSLETVRAINEEWPGSAADWCQHHHAYSEKRGCQNFESFGPETQRLIWQLNTAEYVGVVGAFFGIPDLVADPLLFGGGLHESFPGGFLKIHADFNVHPATRLLRRVNLLLFLNEDWKYDWGGFLELWDADYCQRSIAPRAGRGVLFATSARSFHGHPVPLTCPDGVSRRSIALYYYSPQGVDEKVREHSTLYLGDEVNWPPVDEYRR